MIHQLNIYGKDKVDIAIERFKSFEPPEGYYLCFSGGKDSVVIKALADMAEVKYDAHYNVTGVDPPELVKFIKDYHPDVAFEIPRNKDGNRITMWSLIPERRIPPTRIARYCCEQLKERGGVGRFVITGVRWAESAKRKKNRNLAEVQNSRTRIMSTDNVEDAPQFKFCHQQHKRILNPIIDWTDEDVWEFIHEYNVPYCELYDQGRTRLGCIGCPMSTRQKEEMDAYPKFKNLYLVAFEKMIAIRKERGLVDAANWSTPEDVMAWWVGDQRLAESTDITELIEEYDD